MPAATMPQASAPGARRGRRIDADDDARAAAARRATRAASIMRARPQRVGALLDDLAVDLLAAEPRAGIARQHLVEEGGRQMRGVGLRGRARHRRARVGDQPLDQRDRPRRGGDELARARAQPQAELQHVEGRVGVAPLGELVAPGGVELRPAQLLGVLGRERVGHRAVRAIRAAGASPSIAGARCAARCAGCRRGPRSSPRARRARSRRPARWSRAARRHKARWPCTSARTHSAPARVLPAPRPPSISQVVHGPPPLAARAAAPGARARARRSHARAAAATGAAAAPPASPPPSGRLATKASMRRASS